MDARDRGLVLLAEDEPGIVEAVRGAVGAAYQVAVCRRVRAAIEALALHRPGVLILDPAMEAGRGWEVLHAVRPGAGTLVLALDRRGDALLRRSALVAGADDAVDARSDPEEISARVEALFRRGGPEGHAGRVHRHGDLVVDVAAHEVRIAGRAVPLTAQQFVILRALLEAGGATLGRPHLVARIAALDGEPPSDRAVDLHVSRLRRRLLKADGSVNGSVNADGSGKDGSRSRYVEAVYGVGYRMAHPEVAAPARPADAVLDALGEAVVVLDERLRIRSANGAAQRLLGRAEEELVGLECARVLGCRTLGGEPLGGPACFGRAVLRRGGALRRAPVTIDVPDGPAPVLLSHAAVRRDGAAPFVAIEVQPAS